MKIRFKRFVVQFSLLPGLAFLTLTPLLIALGMWQLGRAEEKKMLLATLAQRQQDEPIQLTPGRVASLDQVRFRRVAVSGIYDSAHQFLLDNQIVDGKAGYFVMTPFWIGASDKAVLVNRGWIPAGRDRTKLPDISVTAEIEIVSGRINRFPGVGWKLEGADQPTDDWPSVVQVIDSKVLEKKLGYGLFNFQVQLDSDQSKGYRRDWSAAVAMPPEKHIGYAIQWFGLALTLIVLFFYYSCRKVSDE